MLNPPGLTKSLRIVMVWTRRRDLVGVDGDLYIFLPQIQASSCYVYMTEGFESP